MKARWRRMWGLYGRVASQAEKYPPTHGCLQGYGQELVSLVNDVCARSSLMGEGQD